MNLKKLNESLIHIAKILSEASSFKGTPNEWTIIDTIRKNGIIKDKYDNLKSSFKSLWFQRIIQPKGGVGNDGKKINSSFSNTKGLDWIEGPAFPKKKSESISEGVAEEIVSQLGHKAMVMMGVKNLSKGKDSKGEYITFKIGKNPKKVTHIKIAYDRGADAYDLIFYNARGTELKTIKEVEGIYADQLHNAIKINTGLALSL